MAEIKLPELRANRSGSIEEEVQNLRDAFFMLKKQLTYLMTGNLDEENVIRAKSVVTDWMYAGNVTTDQLIAGDAKISAALIENLVVGSNVTMGPNATISWSKVTGAPSIPSQYTNAMALAAWAASDYATHIDANGVYSGSFNGGMFNINPTGDRYLPSGLAIGGYWGGSWKGEAMRIAYEEEGNQGFPGTIFSSESGVDMVFSSGVNFDYYTRFRSSSIVSFKGHVDFTGATVTGLDSGGTYKFG